jgi:outer membrane immunogenic protein
MKKLLLAGVALTGLVAGAGAVSAADLPARTAPVAPIAAPIVPIFTWTGFYVGVNAGYGWQNNEDNSFFVPPGTFVTAPAASGVVSFADDNGDGFVGGAQVGYNYQIGTFVVGLEADLQWADLGGSSGTAFVPAGFPPTFVPAGAAGGVDWFGTVRARLGFAFDRALVYGTGGFAYGGADTDDDFGLVNSDDDVRTGWALGGGVEYAFTNNLTVGLEGLWVNLDGDNNNGTFIGTEQIGGVTTPVFATGVDRGEDENDFFVARAKLNFKF